MISHHDPERREVHEDRHPGDVRGRIEQAADLGVRAEERRAIAGRQPHRQREADAAQQRRKVVAPGDRDGDVADRVLEHEIPADDPRDELAERRIRVRVGAAGLRNHRRELGVAERGERAGATEEQKRKDQRGPGRIADDVAARVGLTRRRGADRAEDAGANHRADRQHDQIARAEHATKAVLTLGHELADGFSLEDVTHRQRCYIRSASETRSAGPEARRAGRRRGDRRSRSSRRRGRRAGRTTGRGARRPRARSP